MQAIHSVFKKYSLKNKPILCCPGPVQLHKSVKKALSQTHMCHRDVAFEELMQQTQQNIHTIATTDASTHDIVFITGSGTSSNETVVVALGKIGKMLVVTNGEFGERVYKLAALHHVDTAQLAFKWGEKINLRAVEEQLQTGAYASIAFVHHETSTGMLNPVRALAKLAQSYGVYTYVDTVSGLGAEDFQALKWGIDVFVSSSGKALSAVPGIGIVGVSKRLSEVLLSLKKTVQYLDLATYITYARNIQQTPNTPSVHVLAALRASTAHIIAIGPVAYRHILRQRAERTRAFLTSIGLEYFAYGKAHTSNVITCVKKDATFDVKALLSSMREQGIILYGGKGELEHVMFQIGHIGELSKRTMRYVHTTLGAYIASARKSYEETVATPSTLLLGTEMTDVAN